MRLTYSLAVTFVVQDPSYVKQRWAMRYFHRPAACMEAVNGSTATALWRPTAATLQSFVYTNFQINVENSCQPS